MSRKSFIRLVDQPISLPKEHCIWEEIAEDALLSGSEDYLTENAPILPEVLSSETNDRPLSTFFRFYSVDDMPAKFLSALLKAGRVKLTVDTTDALIRTCVPHARALYLARLHSFPTTMDYLFYLMSKYKAPMSLQTLLDITSPDVTPPKFFFNVLERIAQEDLNTFSDAILTRLCITPARPDEDDECLSLYRIRSLCQKFKIWRPSLFVCKLIIETTPPTTGRDVAPGTDTRSTFSLLYRNHQINREFIPSLFLFAVEQDNARMVNYFVGTLRQSWRLMHEFAKRDSGAKRVDAWERDNRVLPYEYTNPKSVDLWLYTCQQLYSTPMKMVKEQVGVSVYDMWKGSRFIVAL